jgi:cell division protein ZapE
MSKQTRPPFAAHLLHSPLPTSSAEWAGRIRQHFESAERLADAGQQAVLQHLGALALRLSQLHHFSAKVLAADEDGTAVAAGLYLWGDVGRGKSVLLDALVASLPAGLARRWHQHELLDRWHRALAASGWQHEQAAAALRQGARLLVLDELHAYDVADALVLAKLLRCWQAEGVTLAFSANRPPRGLWPLTGFHQEHREHFAPLAGWLEQHCAVLHLDGGRDYRQGLGAAATKAGDWLTYSFAELCREVRDAAEYRRLLSNAAGLTLTDVPLLGPRDGDALRRLVWLLDVAWENGIRLRLEDAEGRELPPGSLFERVGADVEAWMGTDLRRTRSRLFGLAAAPAGVSEA